MRRLASLLLLPLLVACTRDGSTSPTGPVAGTYTALRINGLPMPTAVVNNGVEVWSVVSATLTLKTDGSWSMVYPMRATTTGGSTVDANPIPDDVGTYTMAGSTITFTDATAGSSPFTGTVSGSQITLSVGLVNSFAFRSIQFER